jgi:hypothetical protein
MTGQDGGAEDAKAYPIGAQVPEFIVVPSGICLSGSFGDAEKDVNLCSRFLVALIYISKYSGVKVILDRLL